MCDITMILYTDGLLFTIQKMSSKNHDISQEKHIIYDIIKYYKYIITIYEEILQLHTDIQTDVQIDVQINFQRILTKINLHIIINELFNDIIDICTQDELVLYNISPIIRLLWLPEIRKNIGINLCLELLKSEILLINPIVKTYNDIPKYFILGFEPPVFPDTLGFNKVVEDHEYVEKMYQISKTQEQNFVSMIMNGLSCKFLNPDDYNKLIFPISEYLGGRWNAETFGDIYIDFHISYKNALNFLKKYIINRWDNEWCILKFGDNTYVTMSWFIYESFELTIRRKWYTIITAFTTYDTINPPNALDYY